MGHFWRLKFSTIPISGYCLEKKKTYYGGSCAQILCLML